MKKKRKRQKGSRKQEKNKDFGREIKKAISKINFKKIKNRIVSKHIKQLKELDLLLKKKKISKISFKKIKNIKTNKHTKQLKEMSLLLKNKKKK